MQQGCQPVEMRRPFQADDAGAFNALDVAEARIVKDVGGLAGPGRLRARAGRDPEAGAVGDSVGRAEEFAEAGFVQVCGNGQMKQVDESSIDAGDGGIALLQLGEQAADFEPGERGRAGQYSE